MEEGRWGVMMQTYQARRHNPATGAEETVYITGAADIGRARAALRRHGWDSAQELAPVPAGFDLPEEAVVLRAPLAVRPADVADSIVFHRDTARIAVGVCLGLVLFVIVAWITGVGLRLLDGLIG